MFWQVDVSESAPVGFIVVQVRAEDRDRGSNGHITYSSTDLPQQFSLSSTSPPSIILIKPLDREATAQYNFTITATDNGSPPLSQQAVVMVVVLRNTNTHTPQIIGTNIQGSVLENLTLGTKVLQLNASDMDEGRDATLTFSLLGPPVGLQHFYLSPQGWLFTRMPLDRETLPSYLLLVQVADNGWRSLSATAMVRVMVEDVPDSLPMFVQESYQLQRRLPIVAGEQLLTVEAFLPLLSNDTIRYTLSRDGPFIVDAASGILSASENIATAKQYQLEVNASSSGGMSSVSVEITLTASAPPNMHPLSLYLSTFSYLLPASLPLAAIMSDQQEGVSFSLHNPTPLEKQYFHVDRNSGQLSVFSSVRSGIYQLNVSMEGMGGVGYGSVTVTVTLLSMSTLRQAVQISLPLISLEHFLQRSFAVLIDTVASSVSCNRHQVELVAAQSTSEGGSEVAIAVRSSDLVGYIPHGMLLERLVVHQEQLQKQLQVAVLLQPVNLCFSSPCSSFQLCSNVIRVASELRTVTSSSAALQYLPFSPSFSCECPSGFSVAGNCSVKLNECASNPCQFGGTCIDLLGDYRCQCPLYTSGKNCSVVCPSHSCQLCSPNPCLNGGTCSGSDGTTRCRLCPNKHEGPLCELTTLHFTRGSYARLDSPLRPNNNLAISLSFATVSPSGLLLYTGALAPPTEAIGCVSVVLPLVQVPLGRVLVCLPWRWC